MYSEYYILLQIIEKKRNQLLNKIANENREPYNYEQEIIDKYDELLLEKYNKFADIIESDNH